MATATNVTLASQSRVYEMIRYGLQYNDQPLTEVLQWDRLYEFTYEDKEEKLWPDVQSGETVTAVQVTLGEPVKGLVAVCVPAEGWQVGRVVNETNKFGNNKRQIVLKYNKPGSGQRIVKLASPCTVLKLLSVVERRPDKSRENTPQWFKDKYSRTK